ncbi:MAG: hypothetical protein IT320_15015 [Anaerolineae bacterium]|nr:hypothetical protein [Anaerolineae bacterium]
MNLKQKIARAGLLMFLCVLSAFGAAWRYSASQAQDYPTSALELRADTIVQQGEELVVDVYANIASPAYGFGFQINYDPTLLELQPQEDVSGAAVPLQVGGVFANAQRIRNEQSTADGTATIDTVYTLLPPAEAAVGESFIGRLSFLVLQEAPVELYLESPRLIALDGANAIDLPVNSTEVLALNPGMAIEETVVDAADTMQAANAPVVDTAAASEADLASRARMAPPAQVVDAETQSLPALDSAVATLNTPNDALAAMSRTSTLMNAVLIGLLTMITILLGVISVSMVLDALTTARAPKPTLAYAYVPTRNVQASYVKPRPQAQAPRSRPQRAPEREVIVDMEPTIPSRSVLTAQLRMQRKNGYR